jgi:hypothetical protein
MKVILFIAPLFLLLFFMPSLVSDADALKAKGDDHPKPKGYGLKTYKTVCGDVLCSELDSSLHQQSRFAVMDTIIQQRAPISLPQPLMSPPEPEPRLPDNFRILPILPLDPDDPDDQTKLIGGLIECLGRPGTIFGTSQADRLIGTQSNDVIIGHGGNDHIEGRGGDDLICGENGTDAIFGGDGNDRIVGGGDPDFIWGGRGLDIIDGGDGNDILYGEGGYDNIAGNSGTDLANGGSGRDYCSAETVVHCE